MRFHVLSIPHTATNKDYNACAFTMKVYNLCKMLKAQGHYVIHYGNELSNENIANEMVNVTFRRDVLPPENFLKYDTRGSVYEKYFKNTDEALQQRKQPGDFLLVPWASHYALMQKHNDLICVESGIGYAGGYQAPFKVFESYAIMHAWYGMRAVERANYFEWYSVVIPNYLSAQDFEYKTVKEDYLLFLGCRHGGDGKGIQVVRDLAEKFPSTTFICAGPDEPKNLRSNMNYVGLLDVKKRAKYLAEAKAVLCPSTFLEPFCGVQTEAFISGTPVISSDWGAFSEYNLHGTTGYRCRTLEEFVWAVNNVEQLNPITIHAWGKRFTVEKVGRLYVDYFKSLQDVKQGAGWYEPRPERKDLRRIDGGMYVQ